MHINDARFQTLRSLGHTGGTSDMLLQWLNSFIPIDNQQAQMNDAWKEAILQVSGLPRENYQYNDYWFRTMGSLGFFGNHISDRELAFWLGGGGLRLEEFIRVTDIPENRVTGDAEDRICLLPAVI